MGMATISADGSSDWVKLPADGDNLSSTVTVGNGANTWGASTVASLEYTPDKTQSDVVVAPVTEDGVAVEFSANGFEVLENVSGFVRITVANYSGSDPISLIVV